MIQHENTVIMSRTELEQLIDRVAMKAVQEAVRQVAAKSSHKSELWDAQQCADYLKISKYTWAQTWAHYPDAPKASVMGAGKCAKRRWNAAEVMHFAEKRANRK